MKMFEHEVVFFRVYKAGDFGKMQETLRDWGALGWEVVAISDRGSGGDPGFTVFFKRELGEASDHKGDAA
jgi:hypothetical protein